MTRKKMVHGAVRLACDAVEHGARAIEQVPRVDETAQGEVAKEGTQHDGRRGETRIPRPPHAPSRLSPDRARHEQQNVEHHSHLIPLLLAFGCDRQRVKDSAERFL